MERISGGIKSPVVSPRAHQLLQKVKTISEKAAEPEPPADAIDARELDELAPDRQMPRSATPDLGGPQLEPELIVSEKRLRNLIAGTEKSIRAILQENRALKRQLIELRNVRRCSEARIAGLKKAVKRSIAIRGRLEH
jgi:hypothetical protein